MVRMVDVFDRNTMILNTERKTGTAINEGTMSTSGNGDTHQTMLALLYDPTHYNLTGFYNNNSTIETVTLEPCTMAHFKGVEIISHYFAWYGIVSYQCLPLGKEFVLGGGTVA